jgi:hypothetical protein
MPQDDTLPQHVEDEIDLDVVTPAVWVMENPLGGWHVSGIPGRFDTQQLAFAAARTRARSIGARVYLWRVHEGTTSITQPKLD